jgi:hypothetical protein
MRLSWRCGGFTKNREKKIDICIHIMHINTYSSHVKGFYANDAQHRRSIDSTRLQIDGSQREDVSCQNGARISHCAGKLQASGQIGRNGKIDSTRSAKKGDDHKKWCSLTHPCGWSISANMKMDLPNFSMTDMSPAIRSSSENWHAGTSRTDQRFSIC